MTRPGKIRVGLVFGGRSGEHEISIRSARSVVAAIDRARFDLALIGIDRAGRWHLHNEETFARLDRDAGAGTSEIIPTAHPDSAATARAGATEQPMPPVDVIFPVLHGPYGEDGTIQGLLEMLDLPYVGAGVLGSAVGMDKDVQKRLLRDAGIPVVPFIATTEHAWRGAGNAIRRQALELGMPLFVKPANLGSSLGVHKVSRADELSDAIADTLSYDCKILIERGVDAREIECSVLGNEDPRASVPGEILPGAEFYSYEAKYSGDSEAALLIPAPLSAELTRAVQTLAVRAFEVTECSGMARVDFFLERGTERVYVNELNTIPGFTSISMYPKLWEASGLGYAELISRLIDLALERHEARNKLRNRGGP